MSAILSGIGDKIRRCKGLFIFLILATIIVSIIAIYSAINFETIAITIDIGNVTFVKFLKGETSFLPLIFGSLIILVVFVGICCVCCAKKFLVPFSFLVYLPLILIIFFFLPNIIKISYIKARKKERTEITFSVR